MKRSSPLRNKGESRDNAILRDARSAALERDGWECQAVLRGMPDECAGPLHAHHILRRSQGGLDHPSNLLTTCQFHHELIHARPARAYELGLLQRSGDTECQTCGHVSRLHAISTGQCTWGPYGMGCPCQTFVEVAA